MIFMRRVVFILVFVFLAVLVLLDKVKIKCNAWTFFYLA